MSRDTTLIEQTLPDLGDQSSKWQKHGAGQRAMAYALVYPEASNKGGRGKKSVDSVNSIDRAYVSRARYVLRHEDLREQVMGWRGRKTVSSGNGFEMSKAHISRARYVIRNEPTLPDLEWPGRALA